MTISYHDKQNAELLIRLVHWRRFDLQVHEMQSALTKRNVRFHAKDLKPVLSELLCEALERQLDHLPSVLSKIRTLQIEALENGRNKDGYNKKCIFARLKSRGLRTTGTKREMISRLKDAMTEEKRNFDRKLANEMNARKTKADEANRLRALQRQAAASASSLPQNVASPQILTSEQRQRTETNRQRALQCKVATPDSTGTGLSQNIASPPPTLLTAEQRQRMEANRQRALQRKAAASARTSLSQNIASPPTLLTAEQKERMEANRQRALQRKAAASSARSSLPQCNIVPPSSPFLTAKQKQHIEANHVQALRKAAACSGKPQTFTPSPTLRAQQKQPMEANRQLLPLQQQNVPSKPALVSPNLRVQPVNRSFES